MTTALAVDVQQVKKTFLQGGATIEILKDVTLAMPAGETVAILGQSGSGKSTLLSLLAGLDRQSSGLLSIGGRDLSSLTEETLTEFRARTIGIVFQQFHLMSHLTALENITLPLEIRGEPHATAQGLEWLKRVGLSDRQTHRPSQLSGGERQRVAIARALAVRPQLLLADEPSGNLDAHTGDYVMDLLFDLVSTQATTLVLVTHHEPLARRCHRRLQLIDGMLADMR